MMLGSSLGNLIASPVVVFNYDYDLVIGTDDNDVDLAQRLLAAGWNGTQVVGVRCTINSGVKIGSGSSAASFTIPELPAGSNVLLVNNGSILGRGGKGGNGGSYERWTGDSAFIFPPEAGAPGGTALRTRTPTTIHNAGQIFGGGGGGGGVKAFEPSGGGGGGGGQGLVGGDGGLGGYWFDEPSGTYNDAAPGTPGSVEGPGQGGGSAGPTAGDGGVWGSPGQPPVNVDENGAPGGAAGAAIDGISFVTWAAQGAIAGPTI